MRKKPQQSRSKFLVENILEAAAQVISKEGFDSATTPRIAEAAGISVGSLYQYFENKEQIFEAMLANMIIDVLGIIDQVVQQTDRQQQDPHHPTYTLESWVTELLTQIQAFLELRGSHYLALIINWHRLDFNIGANELQRKLQTVLAFQLLKYYPKEQLPDNIDAKVFIIINSAVFTLTRYISHPPANISQEVLIAELAKMVQMILVNDS